ncbi:hypothetical protein B0T14DRAFT_309758 [Immersiella caudata]|uniref:Uncharacterized protein n=1 Tax=Immersiella caudata TaxID=314043 RepID=A0AA39WFN2_9PEZI|nr:hypothetical protein B0T14DRAFT_309758 [Immersiella caudata]
MIEPTHRFSHELRRDYPPALISGGVLLGLVPRSRPGTYCALPLDIPNLMVPGYARFATLLCRNNPSDDRLVGLLLQEWGEGYCGRTSELLVLKRKVPIGAKNFRSDVKKLHVMPERPLRLRHCDIVFRRHFKNSAFGWNISRGRTPGGRYAWDRMNWATHDNVLRLAPGATGQEAVWFVYDIGPSRRVSVLFRRLPGSYNLGPLLARIIPSELDEPPGNEDDDDQAAMDAQAGVDSGDRARMHVMKTPCDTWILEDEAFPKIYIMAERRELDGRSGEAVDIIDLFIHPEGPEADQAKKALLSLENQALSTESG